MATHYGRRRSVASRLRMVFRADAIDAVGDKTKVAPGRDHELRNIDNPRALVTPGRSDLRPTLPGSDMTTYPHELTRSQRNPRPCEHPSIRSMPDTRDDPVGMPNPDNDLSVEAETLPH